jgi:hypothetical protein
MNERAMNPTGDASGYSTQRWICQMVGLWFSETTGFQQLTSIFHAESELSISHKNFHTLSSRCFAASTSNRIGKQISQVCYTVCYVERFSNAQNFGTLHHGTWFLKLLVWSLGTSLKSSMITVVSTYSLGKQVKLNTGKKKCKFIPRFLSTTPWTHVGVQVHHYF